MRMTELIADHSLKARLYLRQCGADQFWGKCPWCKGMAKLMIDPQKEQAWCINRKCVAYMRRLTPSMLDDALRHTDF